jgi:hypothetical protein
VRWYEAFWRPQERTDASMVMCISTACASGWTTGISFFKPFVHYREKAVFIVGPEKGWVWGEGSGEGWGREVGST